jgi:tripartite-type tricarboxylate transporter receptor subunit TctC
VTVNHRVRFHLAIAVALLAAAFACSKAPAQENYPSRPVRLIVAFAPGGVADVMGRLTAQALQPRLHQTVFVDNKPGGDPTATRSSSAASAVRSFRR